MLLDVDEIKRRSDLVPTFVEGTTLRQDLRQHLKIITDIECLVQKLEKRNVNLQDIVKLYHTGTFYFLIIYFSTICMCNYA